MKIKALFLIALFFVYLTSAGQTTFEKLLDSGEIDNSCRIIQTRDSCFVWASYTVGPAPFKIYLVKLSPAGDTIWAKTYLDTKSVLLNSLKEANNGDLIMVGAREVSSQNYDYYLLKFNSNGDSLLFRTYTGSYEDIAYDIVLGNSSYTMIGTSASFSSIIGTGHSCTYMLKTDLDGNPQWAKSFEARDYNLSYQIQQLYNGDYVFSSISNYNGQESNYCSFIMKVDSSGSIKWMKPVVSDTLRIGVNSIGILQNQDLILGGMSKEPDGIWHAFICKTDTSGNTIWDKTYFGSELSGIGSLDCNEYDEIYVCGLKAPAAKRPENQISNTQIKWYECSLMVMKLNSFGDTLWSRLYQKNYSTLGRSIKICNDGGLIILAEAKDNDFSVTDIYILKINELGYLIFPEWDQRSSGIRIFPNPSPNGYLTIQCETCNSVFTYKIYNYSGQCVTKGHLSGKTTYLYMPQKGVYFIDVEGPLFKTVKKVIIN